MKYFVFDNERKNTVYHEFQKGRFDGQYILEKRFYFLSDDYLVTLKIKDLFAWIIPNYNDYSELFFIQRGLLTPTS